VTTRSVSPASARRAAPYSRTVSSIAYRVPAPVSVTVSSDWSTRSASTSTASGPSIRSAAANAKPPGNSDSARIAARARSSSRCQLQSTTACRVRCRSGASRAPPRSSANRSDNRSAISGTDITRTRAAAASSTASGSCGSRYTDSAETDSGSGWW